jgi:hypothetical protein
MRQRISELALLCLAFSACGNGSEGTAPATRTSALSNAAEVLCEGGCPPYDAAVKLVNTKNGTVPASGVCSGTIIGSVSVLTSAKCLTENSFNPAKVCITSRIGDTRCDPGAGLSELYYMRKTFIHPTFTGAVGTGFDAAVVVFDRPILPFTLGSISITPTPIDDQGFAVGTQGMLFGYGISPTNPSMSGKKQVRSDIPSIASSFANYIALQDVALFPGDYGGGFLNPSNQIAGISSFSQNGLPFLTRTQPIAAWIHQPIGVSTPTCSPNFAGRFLYSTIAGKCLEGLDNTTVGLSYCQCKLSQRWGTQPGIVGSGYQNLGLQNRCLSAAKPVTLAACGAMSDASQDWLLLGGGAHTQLTARVGSTLLTSTVNTAVADAGPNTNAILWWELKQ